MGSINVNTVNYRDQQQFDRFFATAFDKYDKNKDGRIDYNEFQPLINDMCQQIIRQYGNGPTVDKIRQAWNAMDSNRSGYITRQEFTTKAQKEIEKILSQPAPGQYPPQQQHGNMGYNQYQQPHQAYAPHQAYGPHQGYPPQQGYGPHQAYGGYGAHGY